MVRKPGGAARSTCPLSAFLELFGDRWSLLVVRDLMFSERCAFNEFLSAQEGIATNVLADRLRRLEAQGVVTRKAHPTDARKGVYSLSEKGAELAPALIEMAIWAAKHEELEIPQILRSRLSDDRAKIVADLKARVAAFKAKD